MLTILDIACHRSFTPSKHFTASNSSIVVKLESIVLCVFIVEFIPLVLVIRK